MENSQQNEGEPQVSEFEAPEWLELSGIDLVAAASEDILRNSAETRDKRMTAQKILDEAKSVGELNVSDRTFFQYLSKLAKLTESPIASVGKGRNGGYYLSEQTAAIAKEAGQRTQTIQPAPTGEYQKRKVGFIHPSYLGC